MHKRSAVAIVTGLVTLAGFCGQFASPAAGSSRAARPTLTGTWSGTYSGAYRGAFTLRWTQRVSRLSGTITLPNVGRTSVTGRVHGTSIRFGAVGNGAAITYTGSFSANSMSGTYQTGGASGSWSAHKK